MLSYGGTNIVWKQIGMDPEGPGEGGDTDNPVDDPVSNGGAGSGAVITPPDNGWKEGSNTFVVSCDVPCAVMISRDGGTTYERLPATKETEGYRFSVDNMTQDTIIAVAVVGDANGDGIFSNSDITRLRAAYAGKIELTALQTICCDVNKDGEFTNADITRLQAVYAGKAEIGW